MSKRSVILAIVLIGLVAICWAESLVSDHLIAPIRQREKQVSLLNDSIAIEETKYEKICDAEMRMEKLRQKSLPIDTSTAATLYQNWLVERVDKAGFKNGIVTPNRVSGDDETMTRIPFTVTGKCRLEKLCDFLFDFQTTQMLHRIKEIRLDAKNNVGNPELSVTIQIEAISLAIADENNSLPNLPPTKKLRLGDRDSYSLISSRNLFARGYSPTVVNKPVIPATPAPKPLADFSKYVFHIGAIIKGTTREAWLYDRSKNKHYILNEGESFDIHGVKGQLVKIDRERIELEVDGERFKLQLAENLGQLK